MKVSKLIESIDRVAQITRNPTELEVFIKTCNKSIGCSSAVKLESISLGFDWDKGRLFLYSKENLVLEKLNRDVVKKPLDFNKTFPMLADLTAKRITWMCAECEERVSIKDNFCKRCGQRLK